MNRFVSPKVYWVGYSEIDMSEIRRYLEDTGNEDFLDTIQAARESGITTVEMLCSMFAKLCYKALTLDKNANVTRVRDVEGNLKGCFDSGHLSVFEHVNFNFIISPCSRVFTHELVRHRIGTAFSQTSGRYVRLDQIPIIWDPILNGCEDLFEGCLQKIEDTVYLVECRLGLRKPPPDFFPLGEVDDHPELCLLMRDQGSLGLEWERGKWVPNDDFDFATKKKITSAIRRIAPNGQTNEMAFSVNLRALRHTILMRTAPAAEYEIRVVFGQIYNLLKDKYPLIFYGAKEDTVNGLLHVHGMRMQPYEKSADTLLSELSDDELRAELERRFHSEIETP